jgi:thiol-disulfide isomerase/thioredoxin
MTSTLATALIAGLVPGVLSDTVAEAQLAERPPSLAGVEAFSAPLNEGNALIGLHPEGWTARDWINSKPLSLDALRGKVVLVRWWTAPGCAFCEASAPALNNFWRRYGSRGLVVVGFYHHKSSEPLSLANVKRQSRKFGFDLRHLSSRSARRNPTCPPGRSLFQRGTRL